MKSPSFLSRMIREKALELGFDYVGMAPVRPLEEERDSFEAFMRKGWHGKMKWLQRNKEKRLHPHLVLRNSKSVISLAINYFNEKWEHPPHGLYGSFSRYLYGKDYHRILKSKLKKFAQFLMRESSCQVKWYVDDGPILEKKWALLGGIGWRGKNTLIFTKGFGSWVFLSELLTDRELEYDNENREEPCGNCMICMESCPTRAIEAPYQLKASRCLSYQTCENEGIIPRSLRRTVGDILYGCDRCQEVCPWNRVAQRTREEPFFPLSPILNLSLLDLSKLNEKKFKQLFKESAMVRGGWKRFLRNISICLGNTHSEEAILPLMSIFEAAPERMVRIHAAWALGEISSIRARKALENFLEKEKDSAIRKEIQIALDQSISRCNAV